MVALALILAEDWDWDWDWDFKGNPERIGDWEEKKPCWRNWDLEDPIDEFLLDEMWKAIEGEGAHEILGSLWVVKLWNDEVKIEEKAIEAMKLGLWGMGIENGVWNII